MLNGTKPMSLRFAVLPLLLAAAAPAAAQDAYAGAYVSSAGYAADGQSVDSIAVFFEPLAHYGRWLDTRYGRAWSPAVPRDWRPYTIGRWEDGPYGPTWRSDEPFGWAVFHYGRWAFDPQIGWLWLPDTVWGPGWVAWRDSDDVTGWAPLPPQVSVGFAVGSAFAFNDWDYDQWYQPSWVYVPRGSLYSRSLRGIYYSSQRNHDLWERTRGVTRYDRVDGQIVNRSVGDRGGERGGGRGGERWRGTTRDDDRARGGDPRGFRDRLDGMRDGGVRDFPDNRAVRARDPGRDPRDGRGDADLRAGQGYGTRPVPPAADGAAARGFAPPPGFERRDGFVPGAPPPRGFDRRAVPPPAMPAGAAVAPPPPTRFAPPPTRFAPPPARLAPPPATRPMVAPTLGAPPMARPAPPPAPRPAPPPPSRSGREGLNPGERPR